MADSEKKEQKDDGAKSSWSLGKIEKLFDKQIKLAKEEFDILRFASLMTPELEKAFREAPIDADVLKKLSKKDQQEDKALKEAEREQRHKLKRDCIRKFLEIGRELKKSEPESKLFNLSVELLDYLDRIESDLHSLSEYEWNKLDTLLNTYGSLLRGEAEKRCKEASPEKPAKTKQNRKETVFAIIISFIVDLVFELLVYFVPFTWVKNHPNSYGLQGSIIFLIPCLIVGLFKPQYRKWYWGVGAIAFIVLLLSLMGGPAENNVN